MADEPQVIEKPAPKQIIAPRYTFGRATDQVAVVVPTKKPPILWFLSCGVGVVLLVVFLLRVCILFAKGTGIWGIRQPVFWGFAITNFVWWIGIGHAGTFISAILV